MPSWVPNWARRREVSSRLFPDFSPLRELPTRYACAGGNSASFELDELDTLLVCGYQVGIVTRVVHDLPILEHTENHILSRYYLKVTGWPARI